ncbi:conserved hypothetical protein [Pyrobaculum islandicum DSM 4184]|uniref:Uncharacterized protein n=1 Tax=Pyrobaculum islandicum (strain DSM 4184 / JCM 9189 / GEO3) TaxID=384616 RepID=A1RTG2_PYRIL|nr:hypothetical protein [Pyrobaculum islandicum]ABL88244.1 conserved hypothetical protein [Pyrobaculum islandicum DSM 4184]
MIDFLLAAIIAILSAIGGVLIKDLKALSIFTVLIATATFLVAHITSIPLVTLGLLGLSTAVVRMGKASKQIVQKRIRTYKSLRRLSKLEESVKTLPENIIDVIPAGAVRAVHPKIASLISLVNDAYSKGYTVEEPHWFKIIRQYLATVGPLYTADRTKIISEYEVIDL